MECRKGGIKGSRNGRSDHYLRHAEYIVAWEDRNRHLFYHTAPKRVNGVLNEEE